MGNFAQGRVLLEKKTHPSKRPVVKPSDFRFCFSILCCERVPLQTRKPPPSKRKIGSPMEIHPLGILPARCRWVHPMASDQVASGDGSAVLDDLEATEPSNPLGRSKPGGGGGPSKWAWGKYEITRTRTADFEFMFFPCIGATPFLGVPIFF